MAHIEDEAIVLRPIDYSETSQILVALTRHHGKQRFIAKGIKRSTKKRFAPAIDVLENGVAEWTRRSEAQELATLTEWKQIKGYLGLRDSLARLYPAQYAGEITATLLLDGDPHQDTYDDLCEMLERLQDVTDGLPELCRYQCRLLAAAGYAPELSTCVACSRPAVGIAGRIYFSSLEGGLLCRDCEAAHVEKRIVSERDIIAITEDCISPATAPTTFDLLDYHISHVIGKRPRLSEFVSALPRSA